MDADGERWNEDRSGCDDTSITNPSTEPLSTPIITDSLNVENADEEEGEQNEEEEEHQLGEEEADASCEKANDEEENFVDAEFASAIEAYVGGSFNFIDVTMTKSLKGVTNLMASIGMDAFNKGSNWGKNKVIEIQAKLTKAQESLVEKEDEIEELKKQAEKASKKDEEISTEDEEIARLNFDTQGKGEEICQLKNFIGNLENSLKSKDEIIQSLEESNRLKEDRLMEKEEESKNLKESKNGLETLNQELNKTVMQVQAERTNVERRTKRTCEIYKEAAEKAMFVRTLQVRKCFHLHYPELDWEKILKSLDEKEYENENPVDDAYLDKHDL